MKKSNKKPSSKSDNSKYISKELDHSENEFPMKLDPRSLDLNQEQIANNFKYFLHIN